VRRRGVTEATLTLVGVLLVLNVWMARRLWLLSERVARLEGRRNGHADPRYDR
jgi:hypothetical protein